MQGADIAFRWSAVLNHCMEKLEQPGFNYQFTGGTALRPVGNQRLDAGCDRLAESIPCPSGH